MDAQLSFASLDFACKKKRIKRDVFLAEMAAVCDIWLILMIGRDNLNGLATPTAASSPASWAFRCIR